MINPDMKATFPSIMALKHHLCPPRFILLILQVNDLHGDLPVKFVVENFYALPIGGATIEIWFLI